MPGSKTDVYREGKYVYIAKLEGKYCPVAILRRYIEAANLNLSGHLLSEREKLLERKSQKEKHKTPFMLPREPEEQSIYT